jgi:hypothetical protein
VISTWPRTIPSGKGRNGDFSISIILLKRENTFLVSFPGVYHRTSIKTASTHCSPNLRESLLWLFLVFGEALGKALPSLVEQAFAIRRRVRAAVARGETQHGHTWLF